MHIFFYLEVLCMIKTFKLYSIWNTPKSSFCSVKWDNVKGLDWKIRWLQSKPHILCMALLKRSSHTIYTISSYICRFLIMRDQKMYFFQDDAQEKCTSNKNHNIQKISFFVRARTTSVWDLLIPVIMLMISVSIK